MNLILSIVIFTFYLNSLILFIELFKQQKHMEIEESNITIEIEDGEITEVTNTVVDNSIDSNEEYYLKYHNKSDSEEDSIIQRKIKYNHNSSNSNEECENSTYSEEEEGEKRNNQFIQRKTKSYKKRRSYPSYKLK